MSAPGSYIPGRGDLVWIDFDPQAGHEQAGRRPAVVISPFAYNGKLSLALLCPVTSKVKGQPFEVPIPPGGRVTGVVLADQVKSLDWRARRAVFIEKLSPESVAEILERLLPLLEPTA